MQNMDLSNLFKIRLRAKFYGVELVAFPLPCSSNYIALQNGKHITELGIPPDGTLSIDQMAFALDILCPMGIVYPEALHIDQETFAPRLRGLATILGFGNSTSAVRSRALNYWSHPSRLPDFTLNCWRVGLMGYGADWRTSALARESDPHLRADLLSGIEFLNSNVEKTAELILAQGRPQKRPSKRAVLQTYPSGRGRGSTVGP